MLTVVVPWTIHERGAAQVAVKRCRSDDNGFRFMAWGKRGKLGPYNAVREPGDVHFNFAKTAERAVELTFAELC